MVALSLGDIPMWRLGFSLRIGSVARITLFGRTQGVVFWEGRFAESLARGWSLVVPAEGIFAEARPFRSGAKCCGMRSALGEESSSLW